METDDLGTSDVAMETDTATLNDDPLPFIISGVRSETLENYHDDTTSQMEDSNSTDRPRTLGMMLPIAPPEGNGHESVAPEDSSVLPPAVLPPKPSRKVARKSTAKAAKNLLQKQEVPEANNNDLNNDADVEIKRKDAARRLQEKLRLLSKLSKKADDSNDSIKNPYETKPKNIPVKTLDKVIPKIKLKLQKAEDGAVKGGIKESSKVHQGRLLVAPPIEKYENLLHTSITEFNPSPQHSSTPNLDRQDLKRKRVEDDLPVNVSRSKDIVTPQRKVLRSSSISGSPADVSIDLSMFQKAFKYDSVDKCPSCNSKFTNMQSLKKHLRNGHQVLLVRENEPYGHLDLLNRDEIHQFLDSVRPSACRFCGIKYKYLSCVFKHEKNCASRPDEKESKSHAVESESHAAESESRAVEKSKGQSKHKMSCIEEYVGNGVMKYHCVICSAVFGEITSFSRHFAEMHGKNSDDSQNADDGYNQNKQQGASNKRGQKPPASLHHRKSQSFLVDNRGFTSEPDGVPPISQGFCKEYIEEGEFAWRCVVCDMKLSHKSNLKRHYGRHTEYFYKCNNCHLRIKTVKEYRTHKFKCFDKVTQQPAPAQRYSVSLLRRPGVPVKPGKIAMFGKPGRAASNLASGRNLLAGSHKVTSGPPRVVSTKVQKPGFRVGGLFMRRFQKTTIGPKEGIKKVNIGGTTQWKCTICQKKVKYRSTMEKHYVCHFAGAKEYFCQYCDHKSMDEPSHKLHEADCWTVASPHGIIIKTPSEARQANGSFKCSICARVFWHSYNYKRHAMKHSGLGAFKCDKCGNRYKAFKERDNCCIDESVSAADDTEEEMAEDPETNDQSNETNNKTNLSNLETSVEDPYSFNEGNTEDMKEESDKSLTKKRKKAAPIFKASKANGKEKTPTESATESATKSVTKSATKSVTESATESAMKKVKNSATNIQAETPAKKLPDTEVLTATTNKKKSPMDGLTHGDVMQWARKLLAQTSNAPSKSKSAKSKCYLNLKSHKCPICRRSFTSKSYLRTHLYYHARGPPENCPYCEKSFIYHTYREKHLVTCKESKAAGTASASVTAVTAAASAPAVDEDSDATEIEDLGDDDKSDVKDEIEDEAGHEKMKVGWNESESETKIAVDSKQELRQHSEEIKTGNNESKSSMELNDSKTAIIGNSESVKSTKESLNAKKNVPEKTRQEITTSVKKSSAAKVLEKPTSNRLRQIKKFQNDDNNNKDTLLQENMESLQGEKGKLENISENAAHQSIPGKGYTKIHIHDKWMYECNSCKRLFREHEVVVMHIKIHQKNSFHCNMCAKTFPTWMQFQRHQIMSHGVRPIEEVESEAESDFVISDSDSESDEEVYIDMEDDMKPKEVVEIEDVKPVLLKNIKRKSIQRSTTGAKAFKPGRQVKLEQSSDQGQMEGRRSNPGVAEKMEIQDYELDDEGNSECFAPQYDKEDDDDEATADLDAAGDAAGDGIVTGEDLSTLKAEKVSTGKKVQTKTKGKKKQFKCDFCPRMLACASALYRHRLGHYGAATYRCQECDIGFVTPKDRNQHNLDFHGIPKPVQGGAQTKAKDSKSKEELSNSFLEKMQFGLAEDANPPENSNITEENVNSTHSSMTSTNVHEPRDTHSPSLTDSSDGSLTGRRSKRYLCPGCHKLIKSETALCTHMNLCIPDQPGSVYQCRRCGDHFMFRAAHIIHEFKCSAKKNVEKEKPEEIPDEPIITPTSLRKRSLVSTSPEGSVASGTPPVGMMTEAPSFGVHDKQDMSMTLHTETHAEEMEEQLNDSNHADYTAIRTPVKEGNDPKESPSMGLTNKAMRGVKAVYCLECNKELKAWSLHKHVNQCCPQKAAMFHTCPQCGHSVKTYAGYMIHFQLGCDLGKHGVQTSRGTSLSPEKSMMGYNDSGSVSGQEIGRGIFTAIQDDQNPRPIGSMEIVSPDGTPIKVEIDYNFNDESFPSYSLTPGGFDVNDMMTQDGSTEEPRGRYVCQHCNKEYRSHSGLDHHKKKCTGHQSSGPRDGGSTGMSLKVNLPSQQKGKSGYQQNQQKNNSGYRCQFCGDTFFHAALLHVHEASHSAKLHQANALPQQEYIEESQPSIETQSVEIMACKTCGKEFINKQRLHRHERIHLNVKPFKCKLCSRGFGRRDNLRQHEFLVHKIKKSASEEDIDPEFPEIGQSTKSSGKAKTKSGGQTLKSLEQMVERMEDYEEFDDEEEPEDLSNHNDPQHADHERSESQEDDSYEASNEGNDYAQTTGEGGEAEEFGSFTVKQQYQCKLCPITCDSLSAIRKHMVIHSENRPYKCDTCGLSFKQIGNLNRHKLTHEGSESAKSYVCPYCDKCYSQKLSLQSHILTHTGERPFKCRFCSKSFGREQVMKNHEKTHMEKSYECDICSKKFARNDAMKVHRLHHLSDSQKPHQCDVCERGFVTRQQLADHRRAHSNERPYPCRHCRKSFTTAGGRGLHERLHNAKVVNYCCPTCKIIMHNYGSYKKHVLSCQANRPGDEVGQMS